MKVWLCEKINCRKKVPAQELSEFLICFFTLLYVFCYQFNYPFSSTVFLYASFGVMLVYACTIRFLKLDRQFYLMLLLVVVSFVGVLYTDNQERGQREAILLLVMLLYTLVLLQDTTLVKKMRHCIFICSFFVMIGVIVQYAFPSAFNSLMSRFLREDCFEKFMWSYNVDGAYAGFSAYTSDASYFSAIVFGFSFLNFFGINVSDIKHRKFVILVIAFVSLFTVMLTSKRGLLVAMIGALILTILIAKKNSPKTIVTFGMFFIVGIILVYIWGQSNSTVERFLLRFDATDGHDLTTGRVSMWKYALETLGEISIIGKGTGATYTILNAGMHNIYLQIYYDHGLVGLVLYAVFFMYNLKKAVRCCDAESLYIQFMMLIYGISGNPIYSNSFFITYITYTVLNGQTSYESETGKVQS